jgi:hypothetical protein
MSSVPKALATLSDDGRVHRYENGRWALIGEAKKIYGGGFTLLGTSRTNDDVLTWTPRNGWQKLGGPGSKFVVTSISVYGLSPNRDAVYKWNNDGTAWTKIGDSSLDLIGGGYNSLYGISPDGGNIWRWTPGNWGKIGGPGAEFAVDGQGQVYRLAISRNAVERWTGSGQTWTKIGSIPAAHIYAGGFGVFLQSADGTKLFQYSGVGEKWDQVGFSGEDFVATDDALYGLNKAGEIWKYRTLNSWDNINAPGVVKSMVASP